MDKPKEEIGDSWEDKADMSSPATTPDDEDNSMEDDSGEEEAGGRYVSTLINSFLPLLTDDEDEKGF